MAKITISRLFEVSRYLTTESGRELKDALAYISEFVEVVTRNLRNGLTFSDNFDSQIKEVTLKPDTEQIILSGERRRVRQVIWRRVIDETYYVVDTFGWKYNADGQVLVKAGFSGSPPSTQDIKVEVIILFG